MKITERIRKMLLDWLNIQPAIEQSVVIRETMTHATETIVNRTWYRGVADELTQVYKQLVSQVECNTRFWTAAPSGMQIRKIHTGLPKIMVDKFAEMVSADVSDPDLIEGMPEWENITKDFDLSESIKEALKKALHLGDGAWKISVDPDVSKYPIVEFFGADRVDFCYTRGVVTGVKFYTNKEYNGKQYRLCELYEKNKVSYRLYNDSGNEVPMKDIEELKDLHPVEYEGDYMMAVPLIITKSEKYEGRGAPLWEGKLDCFDALDEVVSQWIDAMRAGRVIKYIPEDMIPRDPETGMLLPFNAFGSNYLKVDTPNREGIEKKIDVDQPNINYEAFLHTYASILDMCLQGIMSPATLGIDLSKIASADSQREKKDITGVTRGTITDALEKTVPELINIILATYAQMQKRPLGNYGASISFGEYGAPSFDSRIETLGKASSANIMSIESQVDELWGSSKDKIWKQEEVDRIKKLRGIEVESEPSAGGNLIDVEGYIGTV